jgi:hypothetical protein
VAIQDDLILFRQNRPAKQRLVIGHAQPGADSVACTPAAGLEDSGYDGRIAESAGQRD